jgi:dTDP-4-amino-4,6-dideoxygalactose transaminase
MKVPYIDLPGQFEVLREEIMTAVERVFSRGDYVMGLEVEEFEKRFAALCGTPYAIGVGNGTDALVLVLKALGIGVGDEVITVPNSWISSVSCIALQGARPVFVDVGGDMNIDSSLIEAAITPRTKAIIPVHLTGRCADMDAILDLASRYDLHVIEDAAQAVGAQYKGRVSGSMGTVGCFSLHPLKNLNAMGDAGVIVTKDEQMAETLALLRNHGLRTRDDVCMWGLNSRLDTVQAAVLNCRMTILDEVTEQRRCNAERYRTGLAGVAEWVLCPSDQKYERAVYHVFVIQCDRRDELQRFLADRKIEAPVHYPTPIHLKAVCSELDYKKGDFPETERQAQRILSLPVHHGLSDKQIDYVVDSITTFYAL